jgi:general secretion pathway protein G
MVVVVIMAIIATAVLPRFMGATDQARVTAAQGDIKNLSTMLDMYRMHNGFYPSVEQGLEALVTAPTIDPIPRSWQPGGYMPRIPLDPWETPYVYRVPGTGNKPYDLISLGADRREGGADYDTDITN